MGKKKSGLKIKKCTEKIIQVTIQWLLRQKKKLILSKKNYKKHTKISKKKRLAERPLTKPEKRKVTHYKKKFDKKNVKKDFIKRYGKEKGTAYMYATINKMAKKNA